MIVSAEDTDRLSRALVAKDSANAWFYQVLLETAENASYADIARVLGVSRQAVAQMINRQKGE